MIYYGSLVGYSPCLVSCWEFLSGMIAPNGRGGGYVAFSMYNLIGRIPLVMDLIQYNLFSDNTLPILSNNDASYLVITETTILH